VLVSLCYVSLRWLLEFVALRARSKEFQELEIIVLRHELAILRCTTIASRRKRWGMRSRTAGRNVSTSA